MSWINRAKKGTGTGMCKILDKVAGKGLLEKVTSDYRDSKAGSECALWIYYDIRREKHPKKKEE